MSASRAVMDECWVMPGASPEVEDFIRSERRAADKERARRQLVCALAQTPRDFPAEEMRSAQGPAASGGRTRAAHSI